jgi:hypothetical protein
MKRKGRRKRLNYNSSKLRTKLNEEQRKTII